MATKRNAFERIRDLTKEMDELDRRIKKDTQAKKELQKEIEAVKAQSVLDFLKDNDVPYDDNLFSLLSTVKAALDGGWTADAIHRTLGSGRSESHSASGETK